MNDAERFELVLTELRQLMRRITDLAHHVYLIGGQALALESKARGGTGIIELETATGVRLQRGFSLEPDLLLDVDRMGARAEVIVEALKDLGFHRSRDFRWAKEVQGLPIQLDLFRPESSDLAYAPSGTVSLPLADSAIARPHTVSVSLPSGSFEIEVPDVVGFMLLKVDAKRTHRPRETKDCFDLYACARLIGTAEARDALAAAGPRGALLATALAELFGSTAADGTRDVLDYARTLSRDEQALLARAVVDDFEVITGAVR